MNTNNPLNIIFIGESYLGGMAGSKRIQNVINSLKKIHNVSIKNLIIIPKDHINRPKEEGNKNGVVYRILWYSFKNPLHLIRLYRNAFKFLSESKQKQGLNVIYCYDTPTLLNIPILLWSRYKKFKVVVDLVEDYNLLDKSGLSFKQKFKLRSYSFLEKKLPLYSNGVMVISSYLEQHINKKINKKIPLFNLPITVNLDLFAENNSDPQVNTVKIFYGGSFGEKDGLNYLIAAFNELASHYDIELILTGKPPKSGMLPIMNQIDNSPSKSKIHFMGYLEDKDYYRILKESDIFCMTRVNSSYANAGFPFKLGEMLATGKPVVATDVGDVSKFLNDKLNAILIKPESVEDIVEAIRYILDHPDKASEIGYNGKNVVLENFDSDKVCQSFYYFLQENLN